MTKPPTLSRRAFLQRLGITTTISIAAPGLILPDPMIVPPRAMMQVGVPPDRYGPLPKNYQWLDREFWTAIQVHQRRTWGYRINDAGRIVT